MMSATALAPDRMEQLNAIHARALRFLTIAQQGTVKRSIGHVLGDLNDARWSLRGWNTDHELKRLYLVDAIIAAARQRLDEIETLLETLGPNATFGAESPR
jgi:hypothetical protein